jgi:arylsulfatase A-like enzyme
MLTGLYPLNHRVLTFDTGLPAAIPTLAGMLRDAGYRTAAVVNSAWLKKERYGITRDFEQYLFVDDTQDRRAPNTWITDQAISWLGEDDQRPLFLFVHYYDIHSDYSSLPEYERLFLSPYTGAADGTGWQLARASLEDDYLEMCRQNYDPAKCRIGTPEKHLVIDEFVETIVFDDADLRHIEELYDAGIRQLDNELARLLSVLKSRDLLERTLIVITSDHGEEFQDHGRLDHFLTMYQEVLRVPLIFRGPNVPAGLRIKAPVSLVDITPTILSLAGLPAQRPTDGFDLSPLFAGDVPRHFVSRTLFGEASGGLTYALMMDDIFPVYRSLRWGNHKLIHDSKTGAWALYDLAADPLETLDLADRKPQLVQNLASRMRDRYKDFDPTPLASDRVELDDQELEHLRALGYLP